MFTEGYQQAVRSFCVRSVSSQNRTNVLSLPGITRTLITNHFLHSIYGSVLSKNSVKSVNSVKRPQGTGNPHQGRQGRGSRAGERTSLQHANSHTPARSMRLMDLCLPPPLALRLGEMRWCRKSGHELRGKMAILSRTGVQNGKQTKKTIHRRI